jgi:iron-sulfur cluster repair protein YtfE (RIC family)
MITLGRRTPAPNDLVGHLFACHERIRKFVALAATAGSTDGRDREVVEACAAVERYFERALPLHVEDEERSILPRLRGRRVEVDEALRTMEAQHRVHVPLIELAAEFEPHLTIEESIIFPAISLLGAEAQTQIRGEQRTRRDAILANVP